MEQFSIDNKQFETLATKTFKNLLVDQVFTDVKLVTADDKQIKAHKVILGASSNFFKKIFVQNTDHNLLIYMKDISHKELSWMMNFIYLGQCMVDQTELERFISVGKDLEVEGLSEEEKQNKHNENLNDGENTIKIEEEESGNSRCKIPEYKINSTVQNVFDPSVTDINLSYIDMQNVSRDENAYSKVDTPEFETNSAARSGFDPMTTDIKLSYRDIQNVSRNENGKYPCYECNYESTSLSHIKTHKLSVHQGVKYNCDLCDYQATKETYVNKHKLRVHTSAINDSTLDTL